MKKNYILIAIIALFFSSCSDFLEEESQDLIVPKSVKDFRELLYHEAYISDGDYINQYLDVMSDDTQDVYRSFGWGRNKRTSFKNYFIWQQDPEVLDKDGIKTDFAWKDYYHDILTANIVLNEIEGINGDKNQIDDVKAEALFIRAYSYFMLVNIYGKPYVKESISTDFGVPLTLTHNVKEKVYTRASLEEVYNQINKDIEESVRLFESSNIDKSYFRIGKNAARVLASRIFLFQGKTDKVIKYASDVIKEIPALDDLNLLASGTYVINFKNPEILFTYGVPDSYEAHFNPLFGKAFFAASDELISLYNADDLRKKKYFYYKYGKYCPKKSDSFSEGIFGKAIRNVEAYINRAEAYAIQGELKKSLDDINFVRKHRMIKDYELSATKETILAVSREERRRELTFESIRWFDLRRFGCPEIVHTFTNYSSKQTSKYVLKAKDPAYTLPIPISIRKYETGLEQIQRPERNGEIVE